MHINENICDFLYKNIDLIELYASKIQIIDDIVNGLMFTKDEKIKYFGQIELSKADDNASKVDNFALKCVFLEQKLIFLEFIELHLSFWVECRNRVKEVRQNKFDEHCDLRLSTNAQKWLESFLKMDEVSNRGRSHIIDIATTAALLDRKLEIEEKHIIEAAECKLFDINSWVSAINDSSIPEYNSDVGHKFESWINNINVP